MKDLLAPPKEISLMQLEGESCSQDRFIEIIDKHKNYYKFVKSYKDSIWKDQAEWWLEHLGELSIKRFSLDLTKDQSEYRISYSTNITKDFKTKQLKWEDLWKVLKSKYNYSHLAWRDGYRLQTNLISGNKLIVLDIDEKLTIQQAIDFLKEHNLRALLATTRHHQLQKEKLPPCDRFRIILPLVKPFIGDPIEYEIVMAQLSSYFLNVPDVRALKDSARFFYGNPNAKYWYIEGESFDLSRFSKTKQKQVFKRFNTENTDNAKGLIEWGIKNIKEGERNNAFYWIYNRCVEKKLNPNIILNTINSQIQNPLEEHELNLILRNK